MNRFMVKASPISQCVFAILLGILVGTAVSHQQPEVLQPWLDGGNAIIQLWTNALRMLVIPLVCSQLFLAIAGGRHEGSGRLGFLLPLAFTFLFAATAVVAIVSGLSLLRLPVFAGLTLSGVPPVEAPAAATEPYAWVTDLIPQSVIGAASTNAILPVMI